MRTLFTLCIMLVGVSLPSYAIDVTTAITTPVIGDPNVTITSTGAITISDSNGAIGVSITSGGAHTGNIFEMTNGGRITLNEATNARGTADSNGVLMGDFASGTGRTGFWLNTASAISSDIRLSSGSSISVTGKNSYGVRLSGAGAMTGNIFAGNAISLRGEGSAPKQQIGLWIDKPLTGNVYQSGSITATGENADAMRVSKAITGGIQIGGALSATGYGYTNFTNYRRTDDILGAANLKQGGSALRIEAGVSQGVLINGAVQKIITPADSAVTNATKSGADDYDANRSTGSLVSWGRAPALDIEGNFRIGTGRETLFDSADEDDDGDRTEMLASFATNFSLLNRGSITANGLNDGVPATGVRLSGGTGTLSGDEILNAGSISATAYNEKATALEVGANTRFGDGFLNEGTIRAQVNTTSNADGHIACAVCFAGELGKDAFINRGRVEARVSYDGVSAEARAAATLKAYAFDFSGYTAGGVKLIQEYLVADPARDNDLSYPVEAGNATHTALDTNSDGMVDAKDLVVQTVGDIRMTARDDSISVSGGRVIGKVDFGAGANTLTLTESGQFIGRIASSGSVGVSAAGNALLHLNGQEAETVRISSLAVADKAELRMTVNAANTTPNTPIVTADAVTLSGATIKISPYLTSVGDETTRVLLLRNAGGAIDIAGGDVNALLGTELAFLHNLDLRLANNGSDIEAVFSIKPSADLGLNKTQAGARAGVLALAGAQSLVSSAISAPTTQGDFVNVYRQLMPAYGDGNMLALAELHHSAMGALAQQLAFARTGARARGELWAQQFGKYLEQDRQAEAEEVQRSFYALGFGRDQLIGRDTLVGLAGNMAFTVVDEQNGRRLHQYGDYLSLAAYIDQPLGPLRLIAAVGAGLAEFESERDARVGVQTDRMYGKWRGESQHMGAKLRYDGTSGAFQIGTTPARIDFGAELAADYFALTQNAYEETTRFGSSLAVAKGEAESALTSNSALLELGMTLGGTSDLDFVWQPKIALGTRQPSAYTPYETQARYVSGGAPFTLRTTAQPDDRLVTHFIMAVSNDYFTLDLRLQLEEGAITNAVGGGMSARLRF